MISKETITTQWGSIRVTGEQNVDLAMTCLKLYSLYYLLKDANENVLYDYVLTTSL